MAEFYLFSRTSQAKLSRTALVQPKLQFDDRLRSVFGVLVLLLKHHAHIMTSTGSIKPPQFASSFLSKPFFVYYCGRGKAVCCIACCLFSRGWPKPA